MNRTNSSSDKSKIINYSDSHINYDAIDFETIDDESHYRCRFPTRYIFALWGFFGFLIVYVLRVNLSVAIIAMINKTALHGGANITPECYYPKQSNTPSVCPDFYEMIPNEHHFLERGRIRLGSTETRNNIGCIFLGIYSSSSARYEIYVVLHMFVVIIIPI